MVSHHRYHGFVSYRRAHVVIVSRHPLCIVGQAGTVIEQHFQCDIRIRKLLYIFLYRLVNIQVLMLMQV